MNHLLLDFAAFAARLFLNNIFVIVCLPMTLPKKFTDCLLEGGGLPLE